MYIPIGEGRHTVSDVVVFRESSNSSRQKATKARESQTSRWQRAEAERREGHR